MPESSNKKIGEGQVRIQNVFFDLPSDTMIILLKGKEVLIRNISAYPFLHGASLEALQDYTLSYKGIYWAYFAQIVRTKELMAEEAEKNENEELREKTFQAVKPAPKKPKPRRERIRRETNDSNDPLHGIRLSDMLEYLVEEYGWEKLAEKIRVRCFKENPSINSSLKFLRKTDWARVKVERMYLRSVRDD